MSLNQQFRKIVHSPLSDISVEELKPIALGIWHEGFTPNLHGLNDEELQKAGYLIDRLMRFNCVPERRKLELMAIVTEVKISLKNVLISPPSSINVEPLARKWNLTEDVSLLIQPLLEFQTRHYTHSLN
ncbi:hypothetical protein [Pleurocapsa sp. PCC 7319]|uniref:hypothetical protein n=1 Tax=Pleurocapsa sp. PCC 7319 TaxID=118161 RepID=UPI0003475917|nr:hypothetical protein [Pleurocapsa sp. PCC 7319]